MKVQKQFRCYHRNSCAVCGCIIADNVDVNKLAEINFKMMLKFVCSMSAVDQESLLAVGDSALII